MSGVLIRKKKKKTFFFLSMDLALVPFAHRTVEKAERKREREQSKHEPQYLAE